MLSVVLKKEVTDENVSDEGYFLDGMVSRRQGANLAHGKNIESDTDHEDDQKIQ